jgi:hypothetical protein
MSRVAPPQRGKDEMISQRYINLVTVAYVAVIVVLGICAFMILATGRPSVIAEKNLNDAPARSLVLATDMIKLVISLATGLIAVCVWLLARPLTNETELKERVLWTAASIVSLSASMYFGFIALDGSLALLAWSTFDARDSIVWLPQTIQYYTFVGGALVLGLACIRSINALIVSKPGN